LTFNIDPVRVVWPPEATTSLPQDTYRATLVGRVHRPGFGPSVVFYDDGNLFDVTHAFPTMSALVEVDNPVQTVREVHSEYIGTFTDIFSQTCRSDAETATLLSPVDLQAVKAAGVTFAASMMERLIEERAAGDPEAAAALRHDLHELIGGSLRELVPGSTSANQVKDSLKRRGLWSQYLEVGIGKDAEIFTKAQPLSTVGTGMQIGVLADSKWNNPEPEIGLVLSSKGTPVGATLANDVNLRDYEGRSALLLPKAKDNNASAALGPFIRLFDDDYSLTDVCESEVTLSVTGPDEFVLQDTSSQSESSRDPLDLVEQLMGPHHQYPDGVVLMLGTMFAPTKDRSEHDQGFTHYRGDVVQIANDRLGTLVNVVEESERIRPWTYGVRNLMKDLSKRGVLHS